MAKLRQALALLGSSRKSHGLRGGLAGPRGGLGSSRCLRTRQPLRRVRSGSKRLSDFRLQLRVHIRA